MRAVLDGAAPRSGTDTLMASADATATSMGVLMKSLIEEAIKDHAMGF